MKRLLLGLCFLLTIGTFAQDAPYYYSVSYDDYSSLQESTSLNNGEVWDDPDYVVPVGFEFDFMGRIISSLYMTSDFLGGTVMTMPDENDEANILIAYESDLIDPGYFLGESEANISYALTGTEPNRIFKLEWDDCAFYNEVSDFGTSGNRVSFQLWIFEGTNDIEIHFGPHSIKTPGIVHSLGAPIIALLHDYNYFTDEVTGIYYCSGPPLESTLEVATNIDDVQTAQFLTDDPSNGTILRFGTSPVSVSETELLDWVEVYPTRTTDIVQVKVKYDNTTYEIFDALGNLLKTGALYKGLNTIDISDLVTGIYFVRTISGDHHTTTRVFKQ